jgi:hypothetical protein
MSDSTRWRASLVAALLVVVFAAPVAAQPPVVKTVPWVATNPLIPHDTYAGKLITLKGTSSMQGANIQYTWDFGDGSPVVTGTVANMYAVEARHTYAGAVGTIWTARLTVQNTSTGESANRPYYVEMRPSVLAAHVNVAIDEGLWELHKVMRRFVATVDVGDWNGWSGYYGLGAANINAFEVNGHLETGSADNPYTETVQRAMRRLFQLLAPQSIGATALGNPDTNGNGIGVRLNQNYYLYQGGMVIDAIVASGTPNAVTTTGGTNIIGRRYQDIVQDMMDYYAYCQYPSSAYGGWRYSCQQFPDNSACQWGAIGLIAGERIWGLTIPAWVKTANQNWLAYSQHPTAFWFGYTDYNHAWGPFATTSSGLVQMVMDGLGRGYVGASGRPNWDRAETFLRDQWNNAGGYAHGPMRTNFYYALFSFTKAMLLHQPAPIEMLHSTTAGVADLDWYGAEVSQGDPADGVARSLVNAQHADGYWWYDDPSGDIYPFETAWAIIMLNRTLFEAGAPVAVAQATPNPAVAGALVTLSGADSYHQDPSKAIDSWEWDTNNDGVYDMSGPFVTQSWPAVGDYVVRLRVTDDGSPERSADTTVTVRVTLPPVAPTANARGPYSFCLVPGSAFYLDGTASVNPDEGQGEPGQPGDTIIEYAWDLDGDAAFDDATGAQPNVTTFFTNLGVGSYLIQLRVTDRTATSYPSSGQPDLTDTDSAVVVVRSASDPACACAMGLVARAKNRTVQLNWNYAGAHHFNVYRGTIAGGPYLRIASTSAQLYVDLAVVNGTTYYYVVRPATITDAETCQSAEVSATPRALR